jgi:pimeloyl-ACP methyl ester carboxylesterase
MRKLLYSVSKFLILLLILLLVIVVVDFTFFRGKTPEIKNAPNSISSLEKIKLGGMEQWILIRGWNRNNPVVLFLHGGPGNPAMYLAHSFQNEIEKKFTIVHWDRRGAGKSYAAGVSSRLTVSQTLEDTYELTIMLCKRFGKQKIYLVAHSWGTYLGMLAVHEHPEYFCAYIGVGQMCMSTKREIDVQKQFLLLKAVEAGDTMLVKRISSNSGKVYEDDLFKYGGELFGHTNIFPIILTGLFAPEYTFADAYNLKKGIDMVNHKMEYDVISGSIADNINSADIPICFFLGRYDYNTPSVLAEEYLGVLKSPFKKLVWFEQSGHFPFFEEPEKFASEMSKVNDEVKAYWANVNKTEKFGK